MGLSPFEIAVIILVALLLFGPGRIAGVGRGLGDGIRSFKDGLRGLTEDEPAAAVADKVAAPVAAKKQAKARKAKAVRAKHPVDAPAHARRVPARQS